MDNNEEQTAEVVSAEPMALTATIQTQVATARQYPRDINQIIKDVSACVCLDVEIAASCTYSRPVGNGKFAEGPSIRLAEILAAEYGNLAIEDGLLREEKNRVICFAKVWDMQKNTCYQSEVSRSIIGSTGKKYPRALIETTILAGQAIARRNAILRVIPKAYSDKMREKAQSYLEENLGDINEEFNKLIKAFSKYDVAEADLRKVLDKQQTQYETPAIEAGDILKLIKIGVAFKDGDLTKADLFNTKKRAKAANKGETLEPLSDAKKEEATE